jgi:glycosyltransferase involved in cell wall biosynthesis
LETLIEAFPAVLKEVPNARLIIAGANQHTKAGYWESIRDAQTAGLPIEFRGYVPEEAIPELFQTTSVLVLPYDSATGSSGPAHQACEYGVPIVCADIGDFREMATGEGMAIRFYRIGDAADLAEQFIEILRSPELQHQMADQNFAAGVEMSITSIVSNYLRWFDLQKCKRALRATGRLQEPRRYWFRALPARKASSSLKSQEALPALRGDDMDNGHSRVPAGSYAHVEKVHDSFTWSHPEGLEDPSNGVGD